MNSKQVTIGTATFGASLIGTSLIDKGGLWLSNFIQNDHALVLEYDRYSDNPFQYVIHTRNPKPTEFRGVLIAQSCLVHKYTPAYFSISGHLFDCFQPMSEQFGRNTGVSPWRTDFGKRTVKQEELSGDMHVGFALFEDLTNAEQKSYVMLFALQHSQHLNNIELFSYRFTANSPLAVFNYVSEIYVNNEQLLTCLDSDCREEQDTKKRFELLLNKFVKNIDQVKYEKHISTCDGELDGFSVIFNICNLNIGVYFGLENLAEKEEDFAFSKLNILLTPNAEHSELLDLLGEETIKDIVNKNAMHLFRTVFKEIMHKHEINKLPC